LFRAATRRDSPDPKATKENTDIREVELGVLANEVPFPNLAYCRADKEEPIKIHPKTDTTSFCSIRERKLRLLPHSADGVNDKERAICNCDFAELSHPI
jgi:hypothetical protein